jgi:hypothetical protein
MAEEVTVIIDDDGIRVETAGFVGKACKDVTRALAEALGTVTDSVDKPELYHSHLPNNIINRQD